MAPRNWKFAVKILKQTRTVFQSMCNQDSDSDDMFVKQVAFNYGQPRINNQNPTLQGISYYAEKFCIFQLIVFVFRVLVHGVSGKRPENLL